MQRMCSDIPPKSIQAHFLTRRLRARDFKYARGDAQASVSCDDLDACDPLRQLSALAGGKLCTGVETTAVVGVDCVDLLARAICEGRGGAQVRVKVAVAFEDVELVRCFIFVLGLCQ